MSFLTPTQPSAQSVAFRLKTDADDATYWYANVVLNIYITVADTYSTIMCASVADTKKTQTDPVVPEK